MILSAAMMLDWLGERHGVPEATSAGVRLRGAVEAAFAPGTLVTHELGGTAGTAAVFAAVERELDAVDA
jgi:3-isopropylmalate dehydrogenase